MSLGFIQMTADFKLILSCYTVF